MLRLYTTFLFSIFCNLHFDAAVIDSASIHNDQSPIIYVVGSTQITGTSQFSNAHIRIIPTISVAGSSAKNKSSKTLFTSQISSKKKERDQNLKVLQEKINRHVLIFFNASSQENELMKLTQGKTNFTAIITNFYSFKYPAAFNSPKFLLSFFQINDSKQKYYPYLSHLQFSRLRSSPLRAPPIFL